MTERTPRIAVIGVGTMGAMSLWRLSTAGFGTVGFERFGVPHDLGAHGAETRIYRQAYREGPDYIPLLQRSYRLWKELTAVSGRNVFLENGCLYISDNQTPWLTETADQAERHGVPIERLDDRAIAARYPQHRLTGGETGLLDLKGGTLRPEQAVLAAATQARAHGARINEWTVVTAVEPDENGVTVRWAPVIDAGAGGLGRVDPAAETFSERFDAAVITTGAWTSDFQTEHGFGVVARRLPGTWYAPTDPREFEANRFPVCIRVAGDIEYSGFPCVDGWSVKIMPPVFPDTETVAEEVRRAVSPADTAYTRRVVDTLLVGLSPRPVRTGVWLDGFVGSKNPVIDYSTASRRIVGAVGFAGHGFKMSPAVGDIVTSLIGSACNADDLARPDESGRDLSRSAEAFRRPSALEGTR